eukprot:PITA_19142
MPSRKRYHLVKVEAEEDHMLEKEEEVRTEVEEEALQAQVEVAAIKIQVKTQAQIKQKVIGNIETFSNLDESVKSEVTLGTDSKVSIMGKGRVNILTKKGGKKYISDVYFVPILKHNLTSIGQLMQKGYNVFFKNDECTILDKPPSRQLIAKVHMANNTMFPLKLRSDF